MMNRKDLLLAGCVVLAACAACSRPVQHELLIVQGGRRTLPLDGTWQIAFDPCNTGIDDGRQESPPTDVQRIDVPAPWQSSRHGAGYEGTAWYYRSFAISSELRGSRLRLCFDDVNYRADAWLNGHYLGRHDGGYVPFEFDVTEGARIGRNDLAVRVVESPRLGYVENLNLYEVPNGTETRHINVGGILGGVRLVSQAPAWLETVFFEPDPAASAIEIACTIGCTERGRRLLVSAAAYSADGSVQYGAAAETVDPAGGLQIRLVVKLREALLWSPYHPVLYRVVVRLIAGGRDEAGDVLDETAAAVGLRTFTAVDGDFHLNGRRIVLKAVAWPRFFPSTLSLPPDPDWYRRQVQLVKEAGFNALLADGSPLPEHLLDEADRCGLLVIQQPAIGAVPGGGPAAVVAGQVTGMVRRDRNHPCIAAWAVFNGTGTDEPADARQLADMIRQLDPTRPVIDRLWSGPGGCTPADGGPATPCVSVEWHPVCPVADCERKAAAEKLAAVPPGTLLLARCGYGGITDLDAAVDGYDNPDRNQEDFLHFSELRQAVRRSLKQWPLDLKFPSLDEFAAVLNDAHRQAMEDQAETIAANPSVDVLCVGQWQDCVRESTAGLVDLWGTPKPAYGAARRLTRPELLILRPERPTLFIGEETRIDAWLVNEPCSAGPVTLAFEYRDPLGTRLTAPEFRIELSGERVQKLGTFAVGRPVAEGRHAITARLRRFGDMLDAAGTTSYSISREAARTQSPFTVYDPVGTLRAYLGKRNALVNDLADCAEVYPVVVASSLRDAPPGVVARFFAAVQQGSWGILLEPPRPGDALHACGMLSPGVQPAAAPELGFHAYALRHPIFEGLPVDPLLGVEYRNVMPRQAITATAEFDPQRSWGAVAGAVSGCQGFIGHCVLIVPAGRGRIVLSTLRIVENLESDPLAERLLANMIRYTEQAAGRTEMAPVPMDEVRRVQMSYDRALHDAAPARRQSALVGPWPLKPDGGNGSTFSTILPPEKNLDPGAVNVALADASLTQRATTIGSDGMVTLPEEFRRPQITGYVLANVVAPEPMTAQLIVTSRAPIRAWFNGRERYTTRDPVSRLEGWQPAIRQIDTRVRLRQGANQLLIKFSWPGEPSFIQVHFLRHGDPLRSIEFRAPK